MPFETDQKRCFVVMGFGIKTDFATGRKLDLNKSYRLLIKPVVEEKGLICIRADEIRHSGSIDVRMYQELLKADVVIADLSTANLNAFYELGIRHALCPRTTIVISEDKLTYPFDLNHVKITSYTHLGDAIDYEEVERFRKTLALTLDAVLLDEKPDSPVYTYLHQLIPPALREQTAQAVDQIEDALEKTKHHEDPDHSAKKAESDKTLALLIEQGEQAIKLKEFDNAKALFNSALLIGKKNKDHTIIANDPYLIHRLALATYKAREPDIISALKEAISLLKELDLDHTNDPETVALAGAIEKQLYENAQGDEHLENAILYYQRGYYLLNNRYNGINLAFLLNCRADSSLCITKEDRVADLIYANRTRERVLTICEKDWEAITNRQNRAARRDVLSENDQFSINQMESENEQKFWITVNQAEAYFGLGEFEKYREARAKAQAIEHQAWMMASFDNQVENLRQLLEKHGQLLNPPWVMMAS